MFLNRENEPLIFPPHFASRRLKLHEITQRKYNDEVTSPLNATYFRAAVLQVKDTVAKYPEDCIITSSLLMKNERNKMSHIHQATEITTSYFQGFEKVISIPMDSETAL